MGRTFVRLSITAIGLIVASAALASAALAADPAVPPVPTVTADLDGQSISVSEIPSWYCHDLDFPKIRCFRSGTRLEQALAARRPGQTGPTAQGTTGIPYVIVYRDINLQGSYTSIGRAYDNLSDIGWNDIISSFKPVNGYTGHFATDAYNMGRLMPSFCCNNPLYYVGDAWNDQLSSVYPW